MRRRALHLACLFTEGHAVCTYRDHHPRPIVTCCNLPLFILSILLVPVYIIVYLKIFSGGLLGDLEVRLGKCRVVSSLDAVGVVEGPCTSGVPEDTGERENAEQGKAGRSN